MIVALFSNVVMISLLINLGLLCVIISCNEEDDDE